MTKAEKIAQFDPSGVGIKNGNFIGLPFDESDADVILLPVPWDVTVSYGAGTATAAENILAASSQLDLYDYDFPEAWKMGIYMRTLNQAMLSWSKENRTKAEQYISFLEEGGEISESPAMQELLNSLNQSCEDLRNWVYEESLSVLNTGKLLGLVGGDHSTPLGYIQALATQYPEFGILHLDAHLDLRKAYEGFTYSHASIFYNVLQLPQVKRLVSVGIRDFCQEEVERIQSEEGRIQVFYDSYIKKQVFKGNALYSIYQNMLELLPQHVYISFDIDVLNPHLCQHTGTPVPGGMEFQEAMFLLKCVVDSGRTIIGFDLCEVAGEGYEWDGNVGARILYKLANITGKTHGKI
ncbi:MAG: agmatinase family protein [Saprospiraceae bacterium]